MNDTNPANPNVVGSPPANPKAPFQGATGGGGTGGNLDAAAADGSGPTDAQVGPSDGGVPGTWPTTDCPGGPCGPPNVCVNLDFLFVACVHCGDADQVCCPPYSMTDPWLGTCAPGLVCGPNPNLQTTPPLDLVARVCQVPGMPPPTDGGFNHQREMIGP